METQAKSRIHPLVATAAIAVIVLCIVAVAAITGHLPGSSAQKAATEPAPAALTLPAAAPAPEPVAAAPGAPAPKAQPAQRKVATASPPKRQAVAATPPVAPAAQVAAAQPRAVCANCGTVTGVSEIEVKGEGSGLGAVAGGVAGAILGNQVGSGGTRTIARIGGAAGGAYAGHQVEKHMKTQKKYDVGVKMDDGTLRTVSYETPPTWRSGDRVRIVDGKLELAN